MNKKQQAKQSIELLFAEPFTPQWLDAQEERERHELEELVTNGVDQQWRRTAEQSRQAIADKYPSKRRLRAWDGQES
ncbi:hypothetical protein [Mycobacteroides abscessus]|uniref:hypothetical protein n=1 Tax=Mycobacteroides abscessus TaxID=36809 RepID=UPI000C25DF2D|nr:hypothetical protein [Mycobacteroides abscessus]